MLAVEYIHSEEEGEISNWLCKFMSSCVFSPVQLAVSLSLLLGLTWMFGMALVGDVKLVFQYVFTALNAFLGLFIVIMHLGLRKEVRHKTQLNNSSTR